MNRIESRLGAGWMVAGACVLAGSLSCSESKPSSPSNAEGVGETAVSGAVAQPKSQPAPSKALPPLDAQELERLMGVPVQQKPDGVLRVTHARTDVVVKVDGRPMPPAAGLTSWAAFQPVAEGAMVMGDTVVFQDEVDGVIDAAFAHGLSVTALHNHFFYDEPKAYFMHIGGRGKLSVLASGVQSMWASIRSRRKQSPQPAVKFSGEPVVDGTMDAKNLEEVIGAPAKVSPGVVKFSLPRTATMHGDKFGGSLGLSSWVAFTGDELNASIDGDFAMTEQEVQPVLKALRSRGVHVVALHNHMVGGDPFYYFTHFWAKGPALQLALAFRIALEAQKKAGAAPTTHAMPTKSSPLPAEAH